MYRLVTLLADFFEDTFPGFREQQDFITRVIEQEEISFLRTLEGGIKRFESLHVTNHKVTGKDAFELYDTYGFPADLTRLMAEERGWSVDEGGFDAALQEQKKRSRSDAVRTTGDWIEVASSSTTPVFEGYDQDELQDAKLLKYRSVEDQQGAYFQVVLDKTSFYPEGGGQVGDTGKLSFGNETIEVIDMIKENELPIHITKRLPSHQNVIVTTQINVERRRRIENNHTATHLLHAALRDVLGDHVQQRGSLVTDTYLRFDFAHFSKVTAEELTRVESIVNQKIRDNISKKEDRNLPIKEAEKAGARMLFGEKYGDKVRMITFDPTFSIELCGGCHVNSTSSIGLCKITNESAVAAGVRRIEAITAGVAEIYIHEQLQLLTQLKQELKNPPDPLRAIKDLHAEVKDLRNQIEEIEISKASDLKSRLVKEVEVINGVKFIGSLVEISDQKLLKTLIFQAGNELGNDSFLVLGSKNEDKAQLMVLISEDLVQSKKLHAGDIIRALAKSINGGGGGQPFFASAGGSKPEGLQEAIDQAKKILAD